MTLISSLRLLFVAVAATLVCSAALAQQNKHSQMLAPAEKLLKQAQEAKADLFSPVNYEKGARYYKKCTDDLNDGRDPEDVQGTLDDAVKYLTRAVETCKREEGAFGPVTKARVDALGLNASELYPKQWNTAESRLKDIARDFEDGDTVSAAKGAVEVQALYRGIELDAIKAKYLTPVNDLLKKAEDNGAKSAAPKTFQHAQALAKQAEDIINQNRYDSANALQAAQQARYEAAHALHLQAVINKMKQEDKTSEDLLLNGEEPLRQIAASLNVTAQFDSDYSVTTGGILKAVEQMRGDSVKSAKTLKRLESELSASRQQMASMETKVASLSELERNVKLQKEHDDLIDQVGATFTPQEAAVTKDGKNVVIQVFGLVFPAGKSTIEPQFFGLLSKVKDAVNKIPTTHVSIEGHTEPGGTDQAALKLSENRADAVAQYLKANIGTEDIQITSKGFGKSRPLSPNDTPEGKAKNRRIEIVITPDWGNSSK